MKVLLATPYGINAGGIARWAEHIVNFYNKKGYNDCEMILFPMGRKYEDIHKSKFSRIKSGVRDYLIYIRKLNTTFKESSYDLLHLVSSASISLIKDIVMLRLAKKRKIKTVVHFRFGRIPELSIKRNWEWKLICKVVALSDTAIVIDKASLETLQNTGYKNVVFLPNPVAPMISEIIEENIDKKREPRTLLFAGHGLKTKGIYELVDACSQMSNIKLKMIGTIQDDVKKELYEKVNDADWLEVCGEQPFKRVIEEMLSCDLFVLPTYTEGFPNVILESMACGCAIVTTLVGAIPEMLEEENGKHYGILVPPKNIEELKIGIEQMLNNEELKEECRKNVQQRVNERYNIDAVWKQMVNIWNNTISNNYEKN